MTQKHVETCPGAEYQAQKGMVALVCVEHSMDVVSSGRRWWRTYHVDLVESAYRCGHVKEFKGLGVRSPNWARISLDVTRSLDADRIMAALADRGSDEFNSWDAALDWINGVRRSVGSAP